MQNWVGTKMVQIRSNALILYDQIEYLRTPSVHSQLRAKLKMEVARKTAYSGEMVAGTKKRLTRAIDLLVQISKITYIYNEVTSKMQRHQLSFITLTISKLNNVSQKEAFKKCFEPFMQWLRRTKKVNSYVWKAELQERGIIHYHITTPTWIPYQDIKDKWNNLQRKAGYIADYRERQMIWHKNGFQARPNMFKNWPLKKQLAAYQRGIESNWQDPNSTDVHEVRKAKDISNYLKKEFCKAIQATNEKGKIWDCSSNLKKYKYFQIEETPEVTILISDMIDKQNLEAWQTDHCIIVKLKTSDVTPFTNIKQLNEYDFHLNLIRNHKETESTKNKKT